jgi:hypothetical protein
MDNSNVPNISQNEFNDMFKQFQKDLENFKKGGQIKPKRKTKKVKKNKSKY